MARDAAANAGSPAFLPSPAARARAYGCRCAHGPRRKTRRSFLSHGTDLRPILVATPTRRTCDSYLDRALGADLSGTEPELRDWALPYAAMGWFLRHVPPELFIGNPRVHFQHLADRMNEPRLDQRRCRAWACWAIARVVRPDWPADPKHRVVEPTSDQIAASLATHGLPGEAELWQAAMKKAGS